MPKIPKRLRDRYEFEDGVGIVNVSVHKMKHVFNQFDMTSPFKKRDLDYDFAEYLAESADDFGKVPFFIRLDVLNDTKSKILENRLGDSIDNYFMHEKYVSGKKINKMIIRSLVHFLIASMLLVFIILFGPTLHNDSLFSTFFIEGLTIIAWIMMWPILSEFLYEIVAEVKYYNTCQRLIDADMKFTYPTN